MNQSVRMNTFLAFSHQHVMPLPILHVKVVLQSRPSGKLRVRVHYMGCVAVSISASFTLQRVSAGLCVYD